MADSGIREMNINIGGLLVVVIIVLVFLFVWPGPLRYEYKVVDGDFLRFDRLGNNVSMWHLGTYRTIISDSEGKIHFVPDE